jgi:hypothetical protein
MSDDRREQDELEGLLDLSPDDPRVLALDPSVRARLRAYHDFLEPAGVPEGARVAEAERQLKDLLERELAAPLGGEERSVNPERTIIAGPRAGGWLDALRPRLLPAYAVALVVVVAGTVWFTMRPPNEREPVMRGDTSAPSEMVTHARALDRGAVELQWTAMPEASGYALVFLSPDLTEVTRVVVQDTRFDLRSGSLPHGLVSHQKYLWQVIAGRGMDEIARSRTSMIEAP